MVGVEVGTAYRRVGRIAMCREMSRNVARREDSFLEAHRHQPGFYPSGRVMGRLMLA